MTITELEHTADVLFRVSAPTLPLLYAEALRALMQTIYGGCRGSGDQTCACTVSAGDQVALMQEFLSEVLYLSEVKGLVFCRAEISLTQQDDEHTLNAVLIGEPFDQAVHAGSEVKGISFYGLSIEKVENAYQLDILFDV
jgi:SHS2 domain-containing protein